MSRFLLLATLSFLCCATPAAAQTNPEFAAAMEAQISRSRALIAASFDRAQAAVRGRRLDRFVTLASLRLVQAVRRGASARQLGLRFWERVAPKPAAPFPCRRAELGADGHAEDAARISDHIAGRRADSSSSYGSRAAWAMRDIATAKRATLESWKMAQLPARLRAAFALGEAAACSTPKPIVLRTA